MIRIVLADDHAVLREGLRAILDRQPDLKVVGDVANGRDLVAIVKKVVPDIAIVDITMPELSGIDAIRRFAHASSGTRTIILSMHATAEHILDALHVGVQGYLLKRSVSQELVDAVRTVAAGRRYLSPQVAEILSAHELWTSQDETHVTSQVQRLSRREREVLQLVVSGNPSVEIGRILHLSSHTVDTYRSRLMRKLKIENLADLVRFAIRSGLAPLE
jgi:DNA-binding NarL/FixJ family response regulator